ncbi:hypothetical protein TWF730_003223 [Orbilia blumenaviensis]|uniref:NWD NACHT-NTPase N-terminal domain-containing protein n=1 Tax=Orbilia blumenaviensis TaxID=1796055 RepID=A0AAV9U8P7_9PEZI
MTDVAGSRLDVQAAKKSRNPFKRAGHGLKKLVHGSKSSLKGNHGKGSHEVSGSASGTSSTTNFGSSLYLNKQSISVICDSTITSATSSAHNLGKTDNGNSQLKAGNDKGRPTTLVVQSIVPPRFVTSTSQSSPSYFSSKSQTSNTSRSTTLSSDVTSLWAEAAQKLKESDKAQLMKVQSNNNNNNDAGPGDLVDDIIQETLRLRDTSLNKAWKITWKGQTIILRDIAEKVVSWIKKFKDVGDIAVQYDPAHAAIPWACVRFILQAIVSDFESQAALLIGIEQITRMVARYAAYELLYIGVGIRHEAAVRESLIKLYVAILGFLIKAQNSLGSSKIDTCLEDLQKLGGTEEEAKKEIEVAQAQKTFANDDLTREKLDKLQILTKGFDQQISYACKELGQITDNLKTKQRGKALAWLSPINHNLQHEFVVDTIAKGTCTWLHTEKDFVEWRNSSSSAIFWLRGDPDMRDTSRNDRKVTTSIQETLQANRLSLPSLCIIHRGQFCRQTFEAIIGLDGLKFSESQTIDFLWLISRVDVGNWLFCVETVIRKYKQFHIDPFRVGRWALYTYRSDHLGTDFWTVFNTLGNPAIYYPSNPLNPAGKKEKNINKNTLRSWLIYSLSNQSHKHHKLKNGKLEEYLPKVPVYLMHLSIVLIQSPLLGDDDDEMRGIAQTDSSDGDRKKKNKNKNNNRPRLKIKNTSSTNSNDDNKIPRARYGNASSSSDSSDNNKRQKKNTRRPRGKNEPSTDSSDDNKKVRVKPTYKRPTLPRSDGTDGTETDESSAASGKKIALSSSDDEKNRAVSRRRRVALSDTSGTESSSEDERRRKPRKPQKGKKRHTEGRKVKGSKKKGGIKSSHYRRVRP